MKEEKKESPIGVLWGWGKLYHGKFIGSIILAVYAWNICVWNFNCNFRF